MNDKFDALRQIHDLYVALRRIEDADRSPHGPRWHMYPIPSDPPNTVGYSPSETPAKPPMPVIHMETSIPIFSGPHPQWKVEVRSNDVAPRALHSAQGATPMEALDALVEVMKRKLEAEAEKALAKLRAIADAAGQPTSPVPPSKPPLPSR